MKHSNTTKLITVLFFGLLLLSCQTTQTKDRPIKIGAIFMLTGQGANWGMHSQQGAELARAEINAAGGINGQTLEIVYEDNQGDNPAQAVTAINKLLSQDIRLILGPNWSPSGLAVAPIACQNQVLMISPSLGIADFNEQCDYLFNTWPHDEAVSSQLGTYIFNKDFRKLVILSSNQVWEETQAQAAKQSFEAAGGTVVAFELTNPEETDFRTSLLKIKNANPDAIFVQLSYEHLIAKQMKELSIMLPIFAPFIDQERITGARGALEGAISFTSFTPTQEFSEKYSAKFSTQPDIGSTGAYDAVMLLAKAMQSTQSTDPSVLKEYLNDLKEWNGASGKLVFDGKGGVLSHEPQQMIVRNNALITAQ
ncbi:MAG: ABC transporter substrate-binding protein [Candidatus Woesearchaeota archaeon]|nr:ABC transporter substrate-binding protein [Candidatus Woesearchaeota archaeon]